MDCSFLIPLRANTIYDFLFLYRISDTIVDTVLKKSFKKATGYILKALFSSQNRHHNSENWRNRLSVARLFAITANTPAKSGKISLVVGSSYGLDERVKAACDLRLSVSKLTFPHQLMRVILLESIYRAFNIQKGTRYHK